VTRKITHSVARIKLGIQKELRLGNIEAKRDWGHAKDYVVAMWLMLNRKNPDDFLISSGEQHSVKDFLKLAFSLANLNYKKYLIIDNSLERPSDVQTLLGDSSKAKKLLGWKINISFKDLVKDMLENDIAFVKKQGF
jgi:GDPmannose 4,6-dehydratase